MSSVTEDVARTVRGEEARREWPCGHGQSAFRVRQPTHPVRTLPHQQTAMNTRRLDLIGVVAAACIAGAVGSPLHAQDLTPREIAAQARPAVVVITALSDDRTAGQGSGFVVSSDGLVVTNHHVVEGADALRVRLSTGEIYDNVYLVSADAQRDLVVLRIPAAELASLSIGNDRAADVGDPVYVMGNPLGLEGTFSNGMVSARRVVEGVELIQISAPISSGSSGGPVLNARGEVIGIATAMMRDGQNLNLAVPARYAGGLLALDERPRPFSEVASQFASSPSDDSGGSSAADDPDLEPWAQVLLSEMEVASNAAEEFDLRRAHEAAFEMIDDGDTYEIPYSFDRGEYMVIGVCDIDCSDLDLSVYGPESDIVAIDVELDDRPVVGFDVNRPGTYDVQVYMASCSREPCGFVVQSFQTPPPPRAEPYVPSGSMMKEMQAGFDDVSPAAWDKWTESITHIDPGRMLRWTARAVMEHTTDAELIDVLSWRASTYRSIAHDPATSRACSLSPVRDGLADMSAFDLRPVARIMGRAIARDVRGDVPWRSAVDLESDEAVWEALGTYMAERGRLLFIERLLILADGGTLDDRTSCLWQAELYDMAARSPDDRIGSVTLLEFVRAMELLGQAEVFGGVGQ